MSGKDEEKYHPHYEGAGSYTLPPPEFPSRNEPRLESAPERTKKNSPLLGIAIVSALLIGLAVLFFILH